VFRFVSCLVFNLMKKIIIISVILLAGTGYFLISCIQKKQSPESGISRTLISQVDNFQNLCSGLLTSAENKTVDEKKLQQEFLELRLAYKRIEWATEYFDPATSRLVNGPPVPEVEPGSFQVFPPAGLQIMEGFLFPRYDSSKTHELIYQIQMLGAGCEIYKKRFANIGIFDWQVFDAVKLEMFRIITLGIVGFDNPQTLNSSRESRASMESLQKVLGYYLDEGDSENISAKMASAIAYLSTHEDFDRFNRMEFITIHSNPITTSITELEKKLKIHVIKYNRLLNQEAKTLFDTDAFNVNAYAPDHSSFITDKKVALGKELFSDPRLSGAGTRSCQSCHQPEKAFTDGLQKNTAIGDHELLTRNTPTLINAALQPALFYDLRVNTLEEQSVTVVQSASEMHGSMVASVKKLWEDKNYRKQFLEAFPYEDSTRIDTFEVMNAIGSFIRSLVSLNSRFDIYMRGDHTALNASEINGFNLFMGKAKCGTCHYMPLFNGTFPPRFIKIESEVIGVPKTIKNKEIDGDPGRWSVLKTPSYLHAFKIPTVRNAARTAPYMHNGVFSSLEEVLDFYKKGGGVGLGFSLDNQTLPFDTLKLNVTETADIIAFIRSLDSK
jgi:cytochrome c peroxidase